MQKKELASVLTELKIRPEQIAAGMEASKASGKPLLECLIEAQVISPEQVAHIHARMFNLAYVEIITEQMADPNLLGKIPLAFLRRNQVIPVIIDGKTTLVVADPYNFSLIDELTLLLGERLQIQVSTAKTIIEGINRFYPLEGAKQMIAELEEKKEGEESVDFGAIEETDILGQAGEAPIIKLVNHVLYQAVKRGASDIHIEPFEKEMSIRYRIDGVMYPTITPPKRIQSAFSSRIKIMSNLNIAEKRLPQDGRIQIKIAGKPIDIRVSVLPVTFGERIVMRLLDKSRSFAQLDKLGFSVRDLSVLKKSIGRPNGIILVSGPTGSGKTSTLYAILGTLNSSELNIITVEDPIEYQMQGVSQVQVIEKIGLTFAAALRSILRQDPDIIMIGETRDQETAQISIQAALTGHLVLSTIHTNNAPATITRLLDMGVEPFLIASTIVCIIAQRLIRTLCTACKQKHAPSADLLHSLGLSAEQSTQITFYKAVGCAECLHTGYKGRVAIFEIMEMTTGVAKLTMQRSDASVVRKQAMSDGMTLLLQDGISKIKQGITTIEEVLAAASTEEVGERDH